MDRLAKTVGSAVTSSQSPAQRLQYIRLVLLIFVAIQALFVANEFIFLRESPSVELIVSLVVMIALYCLVSSETINIAATAMLWTIASVAAFIAWETDGLYATSILSFPCILVFAALLGVRMLPLSAYMLLVFYFFAYSFETGLHESNLSVDTSQWRKANNLAIILIAYYVGIVLTGKYIERLLQSGADKQKRSEKAEQETRNLLLFDQLTGLPSEQSCKDRLSSLVGSGGVSHNLVGFITLDINNFSWINSSFGHDVGDQVLVHVAQRLATLANDRVQIYRSQGNEFIMVAQCLDSLEVSEYSHQITQAISRPVKVENYELELSSSIGISIAPLDGTSYDELRRKSHTALSRSKNDEPNTQRFFVPAMEESIQSRLKMVQELKNALKHGELELNYQAQVDLASETVVGAEALLRWKRDGVEFVSTVEMIAAAEEAGLIADIGHWVLDRACADCKEWHDQGYPDLCVAVNLSPQQFRRGNLPKLVAKALEKSGISAASLELEITESLFVEDTDYVKEQIDQLSALGVSIAIDDFGTGYSNLSSLTKFNASTLKIDKSFIDNMMTSPQQEHIVTAIIKMSKVMNLTNVAEGVEDRETNIRLKELGCQFVQGYYWSKPLPSQEFLSLLADRGKTGGLGKQLDFTHQDGGMQAAE